MCGIIGGFSFREEGKHTLDQINKAICFINHRGPDGEGIYKEGNVALGHKRLSIIDTSTEANQPMFSADKRYCMIFNGEIFNYKELVKQYLPNFNFKTSSDTEVFLQLFAEKGPDCFSLLRGFYAASIYDQQKNELLVVRDRYGKKPLHYFQNESVLLFASELKGLMAFGIPREINWDILPYYFQLNYIPQPYSVLVGVQKLMPGHYMKVNASGVTVHQYYELKVQKEKYQTYTYEQAKTQLVELMDEATRLRLISDVPLGAFLSGGIDSSVVVALASRHQQKLKTFSIGYKDHPFFDETEYANLVAKKYDTEHTVFSLTNNDFLEHIDDVLDAMDEPFADSSSIPTYILAKYTKRHVTVALSGDGGDEVFAGYNKHNAELQVSQTSLTKRIVKGLAPLWKVLPKSRNNKFTNTVRQLHRFAEGAQFSAADRYWHWASMISEEEAHRIFKKSNAGNIDLKASITKSINGDLNEVLLTDMKLVLLGDMLVKVDMMSMANSLEIRSPFLDQEVVDFAFGLPSGYKIDARMKKKIVQDAFRPLLPEALYNRPKKGFDIPLLQWFRNELWSKIDQDLLQDEFVAQQGIFDPSAIRDLKKKLHSSNPEDSHETIWALMVFQHWWKKYINAV